MTSELAWQVVFPIKRPAQPRQKDPRLEAGLCLPLESKMPTPTQEQIIHRAYELWEQAGKPDSRDKEFYHQAEKDLSQGTSSDEKSATLLE